MALDLLADLTEERARSSRRRAEIVRSHATSLIPPPTQQPSTDRVAIAALVGFLREATDETHSAARLGEHVGRQIRGGMGVVRAKQLLSATIPQLEEWAELAAVIRASAAGVSSDEVAPVAETHNTAARELAAALSVLKQLAEMLDRPRKPIDEERLRRGREEAAAGQVMTGAEFLAGLHARRG